MFLKLFSSFSNNQANAGVNIKIILVFLRAKPGQMRRKNNLRNLRGTSK